MRSVFSTGENRRSARVARASGFTLIELLVAVTVLAVMTLLIARIISQSSTVISDGAKQATQNANARLALDFLAREFSQAGGDVRLPFRRNDAAANPYGNSIPSHDLRFVTFKNLLEPGDAMQPREGVVVAYYVKDDFASLGYYSLMRAEKTIGPGDYGAVSTAFEPAPYAAELIRYVVEFRAVCHDTNATASVMNSAEQDHLPVYIDVYLSVLSEADAKRAKTMSGTTQWNYIVRNAKRYHTRCWSLNRTAYIGGR